MSCSKGWVVCSSKQQPGIERVMSDDLEQPVDAQADESAAHAAAAETAAEESARNPNFKWYILHAYSGFERKVRESIESRVQAFGLKDRVG